MNNLVLVNVILINIILVSLIKENSASGHAQDNHQSAAYVLKA